jgi:hypothetical protein
MFPLAFVLIAVAVLSVGNLREAFFRGLAVFLTFLVVSAPFIMALSVKKKRITFGDSGALNYAWLVSPGGLPSVQVSSERQKAV